MCKNKISDRSKLRTGSLPSPALYICVILSPSTPNNLDPGSPNISNVKSFGLFIHSATGLFFWIWPLTLFPLSSWLALLLEFWCYSSGTDGGFFSRYSLYWPIGLGLLFISGNKNIWPTQVSSTSPKCFLVWLEFHCKWYLNYSFISSYIYLSKVLRSF